MNFKIIFTLDGTGLLYNPIEPIHLDALLVWALAPMQSKHRNLTKNDMPDDIRLPIKEVSILGHKVWCASALFPEGEQYDTIGYIRKRLRYNACYLTTGTFNIGNGAYRAHNIPLVKTLCHKMIAYASGNRKEVKRILKNHIRLLGKKRQGIILDIRCEEIKEDYSLIKDGKTMRWLPNKVGPRKVRVKPPYWNNINRICVAEIGTLYEIKT